jgi:hypothetical protein
LFRGDVDGHPATLEVQVSPYRHHPQVVPALTAADVESDDHPLVVVEVDDLPDRGRRHLLVELGSAYPVGIGDLGVSPQISLAHVVGHSTTVPLPVDAPRRLRCQATRS